MSIRLVSWNVNGLRAVSAKPEWRWFAENTCDVIGLQETKAMPEQLKPEVANPEGWEAHWASSVVKKGYSGVAVFSRIKPLAVRCELPQPEWQGEGRILHLEFEKFHFFNGYFPNGGAEELDENGKPIPGRFKRVPYKMGFFDAFTAYAEECRKSKPIVVCGDFNIAHKAIDLARPKQNEKNTGFLPEERAFLDRFTALGYVDTFRHVHGDVEGRYSWWSYKMRAREKLAAFRVKIGYPDKWKDYSTLEIDPTLSYWENIQRASEWATRDALAKTDKPVDPEEWHMTPQTVNAYYNPTTNEICFPAAILQPPFFNPAADDAVNYGAIGVVIGHEMTHGFDDQGRQFDKDGNMNNWWTDADAEAFKQKTDILVKQFDAIEVLPARGDQPAIFANGSLCLGENIADQGGLRVAYTALKNSLNGTEPEPIDGLTPAQRFYLSYATVWAQNIRDEEIARLTKLDVHSLGQWRVDATLRNLQDFFDAFNITDGKMYMPVEERVIIW